MLSRIINACSQFVNPELCKSPAKLRHGLEGRQIWKVVKYLDLMLTGMQRRRAKRDNSGAVVVSEQGGDFQPTACNNCPQRASHGGRCSL